MYGLDVVGSGLSASSNGIYSVCSELLSLSATFQHQDLVANTIICLHS